MRQDKNTINLSLKEKNNISKTHMCIKKKVKYAILWIENSSAEKN